MFLFENRNYQDTFDFDFPLASFVSITNGYHLPATTLLVLA